MFWIVLLIAGAFMLSSSAAPAGGLTTTDCKSIEMGDPAVLLKQAQDFAKAAGYTKVVASIEEAEARALALIHHVLPQCAGTVPDFFLGQPWDAVVLEAWNKAQAMAPGLEGAASSAEWWQPLFRPPMIFEAVPINPDAGTPKPSPFTPMPLDPNFPKPKD